MLAKLLSGAGGFGRPLPSLVSSSINRTTGVATNTVTAPTGIQDGDLLVAIGYSESTSVAVSAVPTGFNLLYFSNLTNGTLFIATKVASSESGNYTFTWSGSTNNTASLLLYRNATNINTIGTVQSTSSATGTASSITPTYPGTLVSVFCTSQAASISTPPSGLTQRVFQNTNRPSVAVYDLSGQAAAATSAYSLVWSGSAAVVSVQFQVTNEPSVAPEFVASSTGTASSTTSLPIAKPTSPSATLENDLMIAFMFTGSNATWTGDSGWTEIADQGGNPSLRIAYKVAGASEPSSYTFTCSSSGTLAGGIVSYRYAAYDAIGTLTEDTEPLILPSVTSSLSQALLLAVGGRNTSTTIGTPTSMSSVVSRSTSPSYNVASQQVPKGPSGTRSMSVGSSNNPAGIMLAIKPTRSL